MAMPKVSSSGASVEIAAYDYQDATGKVVYQVVRFAPKDFRQCKITDGKRVWNMEGVERLPYHLPELLSKPHSAWICEGEKDVEVLRSIGQTATCNPGGAGKWLPAFSQYLQNQCVYICPDRDGRATSTGASCSRAWKASASGRSGSTCPPSGAANR